MAQNTELLIKIGADIKGLKEALQNAKQETTGFSDGLKSLAGAVSFGAIAAGVSSLVDKFSEAEESTMRLTLSLQNQGIYSRELQAQYEATAAALQLKTGIDDDAIVKGQSLLQSFVGQREISKELTKAVLDLSAATGMDLQQAFSVVGKTIGSNTNALARQGFEIDSNASKQEKIAQIIDQVNGRWKDQAQVLATGIGGQMKITGALFGDLQERLGGKFVPVVEVVNKSFRALIELFTKNDWLLTAIRDVTLVAAAVSGLAAATFVVKAAWTALAATNPVLLAITGVTTAVVLLAAHWGDVVNYMTAAWRAFADTILNVSDGIFTTLEGIFSFDSEKIAEGWSRATSSFGEGFAQFKSERDALVAEDNEQQLALDDAKDQARRQRNNLAFQEQTQSQKDLSEALKKLKDQEYQDQIKRDATFLDNQRKFGIAYAGVYKGMQNDIYQGQKQAYGELAALQDSSNATLKSVGKAGAIANITFKSAEGAMAAYAGFVTAFGPFGVAPGIAAAAAILAYGGEQIGRVTAAKDGGLLTGGIPGIDSIPVLAQQGELVTPTQNFEEVVGSVAATRIAEERGLIGPNGTEGSNKTYNFYGDVLADDAFIDRFAQMLSDRVEFGNLRLLASEV